jgi:hypothetical protein
MRAAAKAQVNFKLIFLIPLTSATLAILSFRHWQGGRRDGERT